MFVVQQVLICPLKNFKRDRIKSKSNKILIIDIRKAHLAEDVNRLLAEYTADYQINAVIAGVPTAKELL
jgi:hypothetical protein